MDHLQLVDKELESIFENANEEDNIILFSDHGSDLFPFDIEGYEITVNSTLSGKSIPTGFSL